MATFRAQQIWRTWLEKPALFVRHWLLRKLAGKATVVINARFRNGTLEIDCPNSLVADSEFM